MPLKTSDRDIAVIGMACRFPGADSLEEYWHNLVNGIESIEEIDQSPVDAHTVPFASPLNGDVLSFDADFFGIGYRDAALMDPQHRMFLECAWHALEHSGIRPGRLQDTGLFAGCSSSAYLPHLRKSGLMEKFQPSEFELQITNDKDYLVTRTAWHLGLEGPVVGVQAACATSLVAVAEAAEALRARRCRFALAGGCTVRFPQRVAYQAQQGMIYAKNGHCMPFSSQASGTVFGSGVALIVLAPLALALAEKHHVLAVIKGCAVNNDGARKVGFTTSSIDGQRRVISSAMSDGGLTPMDMRAMEAHGTGTMAGDPIEFNALAQVFAAHRVAPRTCALGSVKANIGHLETCAGMAGLIKAVLEIQHRSIAPQIHLDEINPSIELRESPFYFPKAAEPWHVNDTRTTIGVSAFGIGGTNAHILLARPSKGHQLDLPEPAVFPAVVPVSGHTEVACHKLIRSYQTDLRGKPANRIAWSAQTTRRPLRYRATLIASKDGELELDGVVQDVGRGKAPVIFLFPGQGSQFVGMATALVKSNPSFASDLRALALLLREHANVDISFLLQDGNHDADLTCTATAQPALTAVQIALSRLLARHGVVPDGIVGHSLGEIAAAYAAGMISDEQAVLFSAHRGRLMAALPQGSMLAVSMNAEACQSSLSDDVSLAAVNGEDACVLSGPKASIRRVQAALTASGIRCHALKVSHAFHSSMMDPVLADLANVAPPFRPATSDISFYSTLLGAKFSPNAQMTLDGAYWARHARETVRYLNAIESVPAARQTVFVEVGPGATLTALTMALRPKDLAIHTMAGERDSSKDSAVWGSALQKLWMAGLHIDWRHSWDIPAQTLCLPSYPFDQRRHGPVPEATISASSPMSKANPTPQTAPTKYASLETAVTALWERTTGSAPAGMHQLFSDAGGDSLAALHLVALVEKELALKISSSDFLRDPTPAGLCACLTNASSAAAFHVHP